MTTNNTTTAPAPEPEPEDEELVLMERAEIAQRESALKIKGSDELRKVVEKQISDLSAREENLKKEAISLESNRSELASAVEESALARYEHPPLRWRDLLERREELSHHLRLTDHLEAVAILRPQARQFALELVRPQGVVDAD